MPQKNRKTDWKAYLHDTASNEVLQSCKRKKNRCGAEIEVREGQFLLPQIIDLNKTFLRQVYTG